MKALTEVLPDRAKRPLDNPEGNGPERVDDAPALETPPMKARPRSGTETVVAAEKLPTTGCCTVSSCPNTPGGSQIHTAAPARTKGRRRTASFSSAPFP